MGDDRDIPLDPLHHRGSCSVKQSQSHKFPCSKNVDNSGIMGETTISTVLFGQIQLLMVPEEYEQ